jgi:hypothetical protein
VVGLDGDEGAVDGGEREARELVSDGFRGSSPNAVANGPWCELQNSHGAAAKVGRPVISRWLLAVLRVLT